jgi:hypothetical protein
VEKNERTNIADIGGEGEWEKRRLDCINSRQRLMVRRSREVDKGQRTDEKKAARGSGWISAYLCVWVQLVDV